MCDKLNFSCLRINLHDFTPVFDLWIYASTSRHDCCCEVGIKISILIDKAERELMEISGSLPVIRDGLVLIGDFVSIEIDQFSQLLLLQNINLIVHHLQAERLCKSISNFFDHDIIRIICIQIAQ